MKRLFRILLSGGAGVSLLLCAATLVIWVRSYWVRDVLCRSRWTLAGEVAGTAGQQVMALDTVFLISGRGGLAIDVGRQNVIWSPSPAPASTIEYSWRTKRDPKDPQDEPADSFWRRLGFGYSVSDPNWSFRTRRLFWAPLWFVAGLLAVWPGVVLVRALRRRRRAVAGTCAKCGYDLRATPQRCPECGTAP